jgi:hypothetical protein
MLPDDALKSMHVLIATPCYSSAVAMNYVTSLFKFGQAASRLGLQTTLHMHSESLVTRSRNEMVRFFLEHEQFTHLFWIDADIEFEPRQAFRLLMSGHDVAAGIYPIKNLNWPAEGLAERMTEGEFTARHAAFPFNPVGLGDEPVMPRLDADGFIEVAEAPTGFMCIRREVILKLIAAYPELNYMPEGAEKRVNSHLYWLFFDCMVEPETRRYLSEDFAFCRRWRDIGGKVHADFHSDFGHLGQYLYRGNLARSIRRREGLDD